MSNYKTKVIEGLPLNFESTNPEDFVEVLNKVANAMGGVSNMGVFADITSVTQTNEMIADVADEYISVSTSHYEKPRRDLIATGNEIEPYQLELDVLAGKRESNVSDELANFLKTIDNPTSSQQKEKLKSEPLDEDDEDEDEDDEENEDDEEDDEG